MSEVHSTNAGAHRRPDERTHGRTDVHDTILILDFGSQVTQLIARRVREANVYCEIRSFASPLAELRAMRGLKGIILSGGPASVYVPGAPQVDPGLFKLGVPILGICYGMQATTQAHGGRVIQAADREFGRTELTVTVDDPLFAGLPRTQTVWMSHGDRIESLPGAEIIATSANCPLAAVRAPAC